MSTLLDVNVLVALAWPNHVHHALVREWFGKRHKAGWATSSITEAGFIRISSNPKVVSEARSPMAARRLLRRIVEQPGHEFWVDGISVVRSEWIDDSKLLSFRQVSDAHLVALAIENEGCVATLDRGLRDVVPPVRDADEVVELIVAAP